MTPDLPPRIPPELPEMDRLIALLGAVAKCATLRHGTRIELARLAGGLPSGASQAARWKHHLKELRAEMATEPDPEAGLEERA